MTAAEFEWEDEIFWGGSWDMKASVQCWMGIDEQGCFWAGTDQGGSMNAGPDSPIDANWAFSVCGGPICPDSMIGASSVTADLAAESALRVATGFLRDAVEWWDNLEPWEKLLFAAIVALCIVGAALLSYFGLPALGGALALGGTLATASTVG